MKIYHYIEFNGCKNTGVPILVGKSSEEFFDLIRDVNGALAVGGTETGKFSGTTICLGCFDGVHRAHRALFKCAEQNSSRWGVLLFNRNIKGAGVLTTFYEKIKLLEGLGADYAVVADFSESFMRRSPEDFVVFLKNTLKVSGVVAGYDYRFGYKAAGDSELLRELCGKYGISAHIAAAECDCGIPIKSTKIRSFIENGDIISANRLLGYEYTVCGEVINGFGNGRKMGIPTANLAYNCEKLLPCDGVYAGKAFDRIAVINIGKNPTFSASERTVEVHLPDYSGDLYGKYAEVSFYERLRGDIKFKSKEELVAQINHDIEYVKEKGGEYYGKENFNRNDI